MTSPKPATIVHESRTQRQSVRLKLPLKVEFDTQIFESDDWSHSGIGIFIPENTPLPEVGRYMEATLHFPLEGCDLSLPVELEITHSNVQNRRIGCRFQNLSEQQQSTLHFLISAYMSGDLVQAGDIMHIAARDNNDRERTIPTLEESLSPRQLRIRKLRNFIRAFALTILLFALIIYVALSIYEKSFVITSDAAHVIARDSLFVESPYNGTIIYHANEGTILSKGAALATIMEGSTAKTIASTCDCVIHQHLKHNNQSVTEKSAVAKLIPTDSKVFVSGLISFKHAHRLQKNQTVQFFLAGSEKTHQGTLTTIESRSLQTGKVSVTIEPIEPLTTDQMGIPAIIRIDTQQWLP